jgi:hypothetical protein
MQDREQAHMKMLATPPPVPKGKKAKGKIKTTMHEFKAGDLHSGSKTGPKVTSRQQAIAIALSQARKGA